MQEKSSRKKLRGIVFHKEDSSEDEQHLPLKKSASRAEAFAAGGDGAAPMEALAAGGDRAAPMEVAPLTKEGKQKNRKAHKSLDAVVAVDEASGQKRSAVQRSADVAGTVQLLEMKDERLLKAKKQKRSKLSMSVGDVGAEEAEVEDEPKVKKKMQRTCEALEEEVEAEDAPRNKEKKQKKAKKAFDEAHAVDEAAEEGVEAEDEPRDKETKQKKAKKAAAAVNETSEATSTGGERLTQELTLFVSGIPWSCEEKTLHKDFSECGKITKLNLPMNEQGKPRGIAFITFENKEAANAALKFDGTEYGGRTLIVRHADKGKGGRDSKGRGKGTEDKSLEVWVCGLPFETQEKILRKDFEECGPIASLNMLKKPDGSCRGVAFITFTTDAAVEKACAFNDTEYGGRWIQVERAGQGSGAKKKGDKGEGNVGKGKAKGKCNGGKSSIAGTIAPKRTMFEEANDDEDEG